MTSLKPVFDIGNVLVMWDPMALYEKLFDGDRAQARRFLDTICTNAWNLEQDRGRSFAEGVRLLSAEHPQHEAHIRAYDERWPETLTGAIDGSVAILESLKRQGHPLYAITNFNHEKFAIARQRFAFLSLFDDTVVSAEVGLIKPDPAIFELFLARNRLAASECVFIDDSRANVASAKDVGMETIHFTAPEQLARELRGFGFAI